MDFRDKIDAFLSTPVLTVGGSTLTIGTIGQVLLIVLVSVVLSRIARRAVEKAFGNRPSADRQAVNIYARLVGLGVLLLGLTFGLRSAGLELTAVFAAGGVFAVAVGFATQALISNFVSGAVLRFEGAIKLGDVLEVDGKMVRIEKMMLRAMIARTLDEQEIVIPNSVLSSNSVTNYTLADQKYRLRAAVGVVYSSDMSEVRRVLEAVARDIDWRSPEPEPVVLLRQFGSSSVDFEVSVWIDDPWKKQRRMSQLHEAIWVALKDAGIVIAFPQLDVHFDPAVARGLGGESS